MTSLLWKEWKQNRLIFALGLLVPVMFCILYATHPRHLGIKAVDVPATLYAIGVLYALLIGSVLISQEIGSGAISELFARPVNPWKVWLSKFLFGLITTAAVVAFAVVLGLIVASRVDGIALPDMWSRAVGKVAVTLLILIPAAVLAAALFSSTMTEQPILAILGAAFVAGAFTAYWFRWAFLMAIIGGHAEAVRRFIAVLGVSTSLLLSLALSALIFVKGQLHTGLRAPRWRLASTCVGFLVLICLISLLWGSSDLLHLGPYEEFRVRTFWVSPNAKKVAVNAHARNAGLVGTAWILDLESGERLFRDHYLDAPAHWYYPGWGAAWSPDSSRFAMLVEPSYPRVALRFGSDVQRLQVLNLKEQTVRTLKGFGPDRSWPSPLLAWARSADLLYYHVRGDGIEHLSPDGTVVTRVPIEAPPAVSNVWPRRLVRTDPPLFFCDCDIFYLPEYGDRPYRLQHGGSRNAYVLLNPVTGETNVIDLGRKDEVSLLDISPDGRYILYEKYDRPLKLGEKAGSLKGPPSRLFLRDLSTGTDKPLLEDRAWRHIAASPWRMPLFSPDGRRFVIQERYARETEDVRIGMHVMDIAQNSMAQLIEIDERTEVFGRTSWSPSGTRLAIAVDHQPFLPNLRSRYERTTPTDMHVFTFSHDGFTKTSFTKHAVDDFAWLSDDEFLYASASTVYRVKADGTERRKVFPKKMGTDTSEARHERRRVCTRFLVGAVAAATRAHAWKRSEMLFWQKARLPRSHPRAWSLVMTTGGALRRLPTGGRPGVSPGARIVVKDVRLR